jgi:hypothetical protein
MRARGAIVECRAFSSVLRRERFLTYNNRFVPNGTWLWPQTILTARMVKVSAEFTF